MQDAKVLRVMGVASSMPFSQEDPLAPINRRISIVVLNKRTQTQIESANAAKTNSRSGGAPLPVPAAAMPAVADPASRN
jgi:chemotaxis protein MotB